MLIASCWTFHAWHMHHSTLLSLAQVHGHDFSCVAALPPSITAAQASGALRDASAFRASDGAPPQFVYVSGSEEKVLRVLEAPQAFHDTLALACGAMPKGSSRVRADSSPDSLLAAACARLFAVPDCCFG